MLLIYRGPTKLRLKRIWMATKWLLMPQKKQVAGGSDLGPRPKKLMLTALAGCTGVDVIMFLKKMKVKPEAFNVIVENKITDRKK